MKHSLDFIKNTDLFKYSPYKSLTDDQLLVAKSIAEEISRNLSQTFIVHGKPGTGKTILGTYLCKYLLDQQETRHLKIGFVVPMSSLRGTLSRVFAKVKGLKSSMVIGPNDVVKTKYDLLIVDESHRLQRRKGIMGYGSYDNVNRQLALSKEATQLDWIMQSSTYQIFLYDENQSIKPADIRPVDFERLKAREFELTTQMRIGAGNEFIDFIGALFSYRKPEVTAFKNYEFKIFDDVHKMVDAIKAKDSSHKLARVVSGYAWPWHTKPKSTSNQDYDIEIDGLRLVWNSTTHDWVNSPNAVNEVGCIHTVQGYDLNYVGVIIGPEFTFDPINKKFVIDRSKYFDINGRNGISDPKELELYIKNIYHTLLTRGVLGTYVYIVDENLRKYFKEVAEGKYTENLPLNDKLEPIRSPYVEAIIDIPLYDSVGCGELMYADPVAHETYPVPASLIRPGAKYFVLLTRGDSMNEIGVEDGDYILCRKNYSAESGVAVVLIGDDATLKEIHYESDGLLLKPRSSNPEHKPRKLVEGDEFKVLGVFVKKL